MSEGGCWGCLSEPLWASLGVSGLGLSGPLWASLAVSESLWASLSLSDWLGGWLAGWLRPRKAQKGPDT